MRAHTLYTVSRAHSCKNLRDGIAAECVSGLIRFQHGIQDDSRSRGVADRIVSERRGRIELLEVPHGHRDT